MSLTSIPGNAMEHLILETIPRYMKDKKTIRNSQHRCTKQKSHLINLINIYNEISGLVDERRAVDIAYLDFSKAFNSVPPVRCS